MSRRLALFVLLAVLASVAFACDGVPLGGDGSGDGTGGSCTNQIQDGDETDTDCGGSCKKCTAALACKTGADCVSGSCKDALCEGDPTKPTIASFQADKAAATVGFPITLTAVFSGGFGTIDNGVGAVESGVSLVTPPLTGSTTFTLTVTSKAGLVETRKLDVPAVAAPMIQSFTSNAAAVPAGNAATLTAVFTGGTGVVDNGIGAVTSGTPVMTAALATNKHFTLSVTNEAGATVTASVDVEAAVPPVITSFTAPSSVVSRYAPTKLTAIFTGGKGTIDQGVGAVTSGLAAVTPEVPPAGTTYTLTVTNGLGASVSQPLTVTTKKEIFVTDYGADILVFDADDNGDVTPKRILVTDTTIQGILGMAIVDNELYLANEGGTTSVTVYDVAAGARPPYKDGGAFDVPKRKISGGGTGLLGAYLLSVAGGEIFVADKTDFVKIWNTTDNGNVAPKRTLGGPTSGVSNALATFVSGGELYVSNFANGGAASITVYPQGAGGDTPPTRTIPTSGPTGVVVDGNEVFVTAKTGEITVYDKTTGAQLRQIAGALTQITEAYQCSVADGELFCTDYGSDRVVVFPKNASGNVAPSRVITGNQTYMSATGCVLVN